jgi:hypothetical protein
MEAQRKLALSLSFSFPCDRGSCSRFNLNAVPICISRLGATVMSNRSTLQPSNPDRASDRPMGTNPYRVSKWPIGTNLNRGREPPVRTGPVARLSGIQVEKRETRHGSRHDRRGAPLHTPHYSGPPPPPLKAEWQGGSGIHLSVVDHDELISTVRELRVQFRTPPPIKGRMARGLRNESSAVDLGGWTLAIQICSLLTLCAFAPQRKAGISTSHRTVIPDPGSSERILTIHQSLTTC